MVYRLVTHAATGACSRAGGVSITHMLNCTRLDSEAMVLRVGQGWDTSATSPGENSHSAVRSHAGVGGRAVPGGVGRTQTRGLAAAGA